MLERLLLAWLLLLSLVAVRWPTVAGSSAPDPFLLSKPWLGWLVALIMFSIGAILAVDEVKTVLKRWPLILGGTAVQYLSMPALAWMMTLLVQLDPEIELGMILVGCVPGAMASNVLTLTARGNVSYSVGLTTTATLLSPVVVPLALLVILRQTASPQLLLGSARLLAIQVVAPTIIGFTLSRVSSRFERGASRAAPTVANLTILWVIAVVVALNRRNLQDLSAQLVMPLLALNLLGYAAGELGGRLLRLDVGMRRALMLEVGMQNAGAGAALATVLFPDQPGVALPCGLFAFGCMLTGTMLAQVLGMFPPRSDGSRDGTDEDQPSAESLSRPD